jgi:hypothetical protein
VMGVIAKWETPSYTTLGCRRLKRIVETLENAFQ